MTAMYFFKIFFLFYILTLLSFLFESFFFVFAISIYHHSLLPFSLVFLIFFVRLNFLLYLTVLLKSTCSAAKAAPFQEFSFTSRDSAHFNWHSFAQLLAWMSLLWFLRRGDKYSWNKNISSAQHRWPDLWHYIYCFVCSGETFTVKEINTHTMHFNQWK